MKLRVLFLFLLFFLPLITEAAFCPHLMRNLQRGDLGQDVKELQQFLISEGDLALGYDTGYFGARTEVAVKTFQERNRVASSTDPGFGFVGPRTRAFIQSVCSASTSTSGSTATTTVEHASSTPQRSPRSCIVGGTTLLHGETGFFFSQTFTFFPQTCATHMQSRTCTDGSLSGTNAYVYPSCTSIPSPSFHVSTSTGTTTVSLGINGKALAIINVGEKYLVLWNSTHASSCSYMRFVEGGSFIPISVAPNTEGSLDEVMTNKQVTFTLTCEGVGTEQVSKTVFAFPSL